MRSRASGSSGEAHHESASRSQFSPRAGFKQASAPVTLPCPIIDSTNRLIPGSVRVALRVPSLPHPTTIEDGTAVAVADGALTTSLAGKMSRAKIITLCMLVGCGCRAEAGRQRATTPLSPAATSTRDAELPAGSTHESSARQVTETPVGGHRTQEPAAALLSWTRPGLVTIFFVPDASF